jgi:hypothetical protein
MKKNVYRLIVVVSILFFYPITTAKKHYNVVVIKPVADALGSPIRSFFHKTPPTKSYELLPVCGAFPGASSGCPRVHQLLFHEMANAIKEKDDEVLVEITNCYYTSHDHAAPQKTYWTLKKNIIRLNMLEDSGVNTALFPPPICCKNPQSLSNKDVATLTKPWHDINTNKTFSAGTRFLRKKTEESSYGTAVHIFDSDKNNFISAIIPNEYLAEISQNIQEKIQTFIHILKQWAHQSQGYIPYVWGGCSFTYTAQENAIQMPSTLDANTAFYTIKDFSYTPKPGFDCSNMIMRAAQIAGIPFFFKNSFTILHHLKKVESVETLSAGDIIWIPGHVMVLADTEKNTLIEARGYKNGQGKVQEIELKKVFKNIKNYKDLFNAWHNKQPIDRLGEDGSIIETIKRIELLSMQSIMSD